MKSEHDLINKFQRLLNRLNLIEQKDWFELQELSQLLLKDFEEGVLSWNPDIGYKKLKITLERLAGEEDSAKKLILNFKHNSDSKGQDQYDTNYLDVKETWAVIEHTISELLILLVYYYPDRLRNRPDFRKRILERIQYSPNKERVRQRLLNIAEEDKREKKVDPKKKLNNSIPNYSKDVFSSETEEDPSAKLSIKEVALKLNYEGIKVDREKCKELIKQYGYTSGDKLYNEFLHFSSVQNRKGDPGTVKKLDNQIERIIRVIETLPEEKTSQALKELETLKSIKKQYL